MGLMLASLLAAYMSTIATHLNWGSSYVVNDVYKRFVNPAASEKTLVNVGRLSTVVMMVFAALLSLQLTNAVQAFQIMLQIGAGTGLLFILRWFWWRINPWSELAAMVVSFIVTLALQLGSFAAAWAEYQRIVVGVAITTVAWVGVTLLTAPSDERVLREFVRRTNPGGPGLARRGRPRGARRRAHPAGARRHQHPARPALHLPGHRRRSTPGCSAAACCCTGRRPRARSRWRVGVRHRGAAARVAGHGCRLRACVSVSDRSTTASPSGYASADARSTFGVRRSAFKVSRRVDWRSARRGWAGALAQCEDERR